MKTALAAAALALSFPMAQAASSSWADALLTYSLVDLNPDDGITPRISFSPTENGGMSVTTLGAIANSYRDDYALGFEELATDHKFSETHSGRSTFEPVREGFRFSAEGTAAGAQDDEGTYETEAQYWTNVGTGGEWQITANTRVDWRITYSLGASTTEQPRVVGERVVSESSFATLSWGWNMEDGQTWSVARDTRGSDPLSGALFASTSNASDSDLHGSMGMGAEAVGVGILPAAPVPEPSTWALMALGLAGVGFAARPRRRTNAPQAISVTA